MANYDAIVVGAGPNGLAAGIVLARAGLKVQIRERAEHPGGGASTEALTLPGFLHDVCSAVHPLGIGSPFFRRLPLGRHGLEWIQPPAPVVHVFEDGSSVAQERSTTETARGLGVDGRAWRLLMDPFVPRVDALFGDVLGPLRIPRHPLLFAAFGIVAMQPATLLSKLLFRGPRARALFSGMAGHATLPLEQPPSAVFGMLLGIAGHAVGWPIPRGGSQSITRALVSYFSSLGGDLVTSAPVESLDELSSARAVVLDVTARQALQLAGDRFPHWYRRRLSAFKYGLPTFKLDWALDGPVPWLSPDAARSATVHIGGPMEEIAAERRGSWAGHVADRPYLLFVQPSLFDPTRAPEGKHVAWAYCHIPKNCTEDMTERMEAQVERFAPGFRNRILARSSMGPWELERHNPNLVGGDITGGESTLLQLFFRPAPKMVPYATPLENVFLCSASTPPGAAVHGMCGYHAARAVLRRRFGMRS